MSFARSNSLVSAESWMVAAVIRTIAREESPGTARHGHFSRFNPKYLDCIWRHYNERTWQGRPFE